MIYVENCKYAILHDYCIFMNNIAQHQTDPEKGV